MLPPCLRKKNLPEPFAHPSLPRHPQMSDPPASISVELAGWGCAVFRSLSVRSPPHPSPSLLVFVKGVIFRVIRIIVLLPKKIQRRLGTESLANHPSAMHACHVSRVEDFITKYHKLYGGNCLSFSTRGFQNGSIVGLQSGNKCVASMNQPLAGSPTIFIFICRETSCSFTVKCCIRRPEQNTKPLCQFVNLCINIYIFFVCVYINI